MREYAKKPESQSRTLDSNPKASRQAPIDVILQRYKERNIQRHVEDEELVQGKFDSVQRDEIEEDKLLQGKFECTSRAEQESIQREEKPNNTGLPDNLKSGIENLSGYSLDDVKVHYNSDKPAQLQALAYTQGTDIHVAPGQEQHLPHETWHVVQQKQGRVRPTMQLQGMDINDNEELEKEADINSLKTNNVSNTGSFKQFIGGSNVIQCFRIIEKTLPWIRPAKKVEFISAFKEKHDREPTDEEKKELFTTKTIKYDSTKTDYTKDKEEIPNRYRRLERTNKYKNATFVAWMQEIDLSA